MLNHVTVALGAGAFGLIALIVGGLLALVLLSDPLRALGVLLLIRTLSDYASIGLHVSYLINQFVVGAAIVAAALCARDLPGALKRWERLYVGYLLVGFAVAAIHPLFSSEAFSALLRPIAYFAIAHIALSAARSRGLDKVFETLVKASVPAAFCVLSGLAHIPGMSSGPRPRGTFSHPNVAGAYMALAGVLALYMLIDKPGWWRLALAMVFPLALVVSLSADSAISYVAGVSAVMLLTSKRSILVRSFAVIVAVIFLGAVSPFIGVADKVSHAFQGLSIGQEKLGSGNSLQWRFNNWRLLIELWRQHPLFGWGLGSTDSYLQPLHAPPHSEYVRVLAENGLVGVAFMTVLLVTLVRYCFKRGPGQFSPGGRAILIALLCDALAANTIEYTPQMFFFAAVIGASIAARPMTRVGTQAALAAGHPAIVRTPVRTAAAAPPVARAS